MLRQHLHAPPAAWQERRSHPPLAPERCMNLSSLPSCRRCMQRQRLQQLPRGLTTISQACAETPSQAWHAAVCTGAQQLKRNLLCTVHVCGRRSQQALARTALRFSVDSSVVRWPLNSFCLSGFASRSARCSASRSCTAAPLLLPTHAQRCADHSWPVCAPAPCLLAAAHASVLMTAA
jgi:hypothetical protein